MTDKSLEPYFTERDRLLWGQHQLYQSLRPKKVCEEWGLTYSGYQQVIYRIKREMNIPKAR